MKNGVIIIEGHVQGLSNVRALGEMGIPVWVMDTCHCLAQHSKYCKRYFRCPEYSSDSFVDFLIAIGKKYALDGWTLIPSNDHIVENLSKNKEKLHPYYKTIAPSPDILEHIINKKNLLNIAQECETPIPITYYPENIEDGIEKLRFPILLKGNFGLSFYKETHQKAIQVDKKEDLSSSLNDVLQKVSADNVMIQELIPYDAQNKVVSFTCFAEKGDIKTYWMGDKLREHPIMYGTATYSRSIYIDQVLQNAKPLVKALSYTGVCEIEFLRDSRDGVYKLIEINPRTWLWVGLAKKCGVNYAYLIYAYLNNIVVDYPTTYAIDVRWINWITDTVYGFMAILKKHFTLKDYILSLKGKKIKAIWSNKDIMPGIIFPFLLMYIARKRG